MGLLGAEMIAIEDGDSTGWLESATTIGEVNFQSLQAFVDNVLAELGSRDLSLLHLQAHGNPTGIALGGDWVDVNSFAGFRATLGRLTAKFAKGAWVDLRACEVGQNLPLLHMFRRLWHVGIVAGRGLQNNLYDSNFGLYQVVTADGREVRSFSTPPFVEYNVGRRAVRSVLSHL